MSLLYSQVQRVDPPAEAPVHAHGRAAALLLLLRQGVPVQLGPEAPQEDPRPPGAGGPVQYRYYYRRHRRPNYCRPVTPGEK